MALITKIKEYREKAGYNPSLKLAMDIAKIFNVAVEELFEFVDSEN